MIHWLPAPPATASHGLRYSSPGAHSSASRQYFLIACLFSCLLFLALITCLPLAAQDANEAWTPTAVASTSRPDGTGVADPTAEIKPPGTPQPPAQWANTSNASGDTAAAAQATTPTGSLTAPWSGDVMLHSSSQCQGASICEHMDGDPPIAVTSTTGFKAGMDLNARLSLDQNEHVLDYPDNGSWRCARMSVDQEEGMPGCWVRYDFDTGRTVTAADFYFRRNSISAYQGVYFITTPGQAPGEPIVDGNLATSIDVWFGTEGDLHLGRSPSGPDFTEVVKQGVTPNLNRWYHVSARVERTASNTYRVDVFVDGVLQISKTDVRFPVGDTFFRRTVVHTAWWGLTEDLPVGSTPSVWWDDLCINQPTITETRRLYRTYFQQGLGGYTGSHATYFDSSGGYNDTALLHVGANNWIKSLLRFNVSSIPTTAIVDEATLQLHYTGHSNKNSLTLGAHQVLNEWVDSEANRIQRETGVNWNVAGMGSGSDYAATPAATVDLTYDNSAGVPMGTDGSEMVRRPTGSHPFR